MSEVAHFNLWQDPWIGVERHDATTTRVSITEALLNAHTYRTLYDVSPLVIVGVHRFLTAIVQDALQPKREADLIQLWQAGQLSAEKISAFGEQYAYRFELFDKAYPFFQSADIPHIPTKGIATKSVAYLAPELPTGTNITHFHHGVADEHYFCPSCVTACLLCIPPFAYAEGQPFRPSINGAPPIYILPSGKSIHESITLSLALPQTQPKVADEEDQPWWRHSPVIEEKSVVYQVGYLHSLTFPARRLRLYPEQSNKPCTRCGEMSIWGVRQMVHQMGESRPKEPFWEDPFIAVELPKKDKKKANNESIPHAVRPKANKPLWRNFGSLFLLGRQHETGSFRRPKILDQISYLEGKLGVTRRTMTFRCVALRSDAKPAKLLEWLEAGFDIPPAVLTDVAMSDEIWSALDHAERNEQTIIGLFTKYFGGRAKKSKRFGSLLSRMMYTYWSALEAPFRDLIHQAETRWNREAWGATVKDEAWEAFRAASRSTGDDGDALRDRVRAEEHCSNALHALRKEYSDDGNQQ